VIVIVSREVLDDRNAWLHLDAIVDLFPMGRHQWDLPPDLDYRNLAWLSESPAHYRTKRNIEIYEKAFTAAAYSAPSNRHALSVVLTLAPRAVGELTPKDAEACLREPGRLLVENDESDAAFVEAMVEAHGATDLWYAFQNDWLVFDHAGGGGNIPRRLRDLASRHPGPPRFMALTESDRQTPSSPNSRAAEEVLTCAQELQCQAVVLRKRETENYLPDEALHLLNAHRPHRPRLRAFQKLSEAQRDHFDMKRGFRVEAETDEVRLTDDEETVFSGLSPSDRRALSGGFGKEVWKLFQRSPRPFTAESIGRRCATTGSDEIPTMLECLRRLL